MAFLRYVSLQSTGTKCELWVVLQNWSDTEKISMVVAQRWHLQIEKCTKLLMTVCELWLVIENGAIQNKLARPLRKDDTGKPRALSGPSELERDRED